MILSVFCPAGQGEPRAAESVMQNRLASAGLLGLRERSVQVARPATTAGLCLTRAFA
jgi:hypothetical protein